MAFEFIAAVSLFSNTEAEIHRIAGGYIAALEKIGGVKISPEQIGSASLPFYFLVTGGVENQILALQQKRFLSVTREPIFLIAHSSGNSLPAAMEVHAKLQQDEIDGRIFYLSSPDDSAALAVIEQVIFDLELHRALRKIKLGVIGVPSDWLLASVPSSEVVRQQWGPRLIQIPIAEIYEQMQHVDLHDHESLKESLTFGAARIVEPSLDDTNDAIRVYGALKAVIQKYELDSLTIRCFEIIKQLKITGCFALSQLTDEGFIAGCEGDIVSAVTMLWAHALLGVIPWMANTSSLDMTTNSLWIAHCTVPRKLTTEYNLRSHFESGLGVGIQGTMHTGAVTILRIGGKMMEEIWIAEGALLRNGNSPELCRTQVEIKLERGGNVSDLLTAPLGNHLILLPGHHMKRLLASRETMLGLGK